MADASAQEKGKADNVLPPDLPNAMEEADYATEFLHSTHLEAGVTTDSSIALMPSLVVLGIKPRLKSNVIRSHCKTHTPAYGRGPLLSRCQNLQRPCVTASTITKTRFSPCWPLVTTRWFGSPR